MELRGPEHIIPVLIEGEPDEAFPPQLLLLSKKKTDSDGNTITEPIELLAADLRPESMKGRALPGFEDLENSNDPKLSALRLEPVKKLKTEKYRVLASMLDCSFGDLKQRDKERRTKNLLSLAAFSAAVLLAFSSFMFNAYSKANKARIAAVSENSSMLLSRSSAELSRGNTNFALLVADRAKNQLELVMPRYLDLLGRYESVLSGGVIKDELAPISVIDTENRYTDFALSDSQSLLACGIGTDSVGIYSTEHGGLVKLLPGFTGYVKTLDFSKNGSLLAVGGLDNRLIVYGTEDYSESKNILMDSSILHLRFIDNDKVLMVLLLYRNTIEGIFFDTENFSEISRIDFGSGLIKLLSTREGPYVYALFDAQGENDSNLIQYDFAKGEKRKSFPFETEPTEGSFTDVRNNLYLGLVISPDGKRILAGKNNALFLLDTDTAEILHRIPLAYQIRLYQITSGELALEFSLDGSKFYFSDGFSIYRGETETGYVTDWVRGRENLHPRKITALAGENFIVLYDDASLSLYRGMTMPIEQVNTGGIKAEYSRRSVSGDKLFLLSMSNQEICIMSLSESSHIKNTEGRIILTSENKNFALSNDMNETKLVNLKDDSYIPLAQSDILIFPYNKNRTSRALSNDGSMLAGIWVKQTRNSDGSVKSETVLEINEIKTGNSLYSLVLSDKRPDIAFSRDDKLLIIHYDDGKTDVLDISSSKIVRSFTGISDRAESFVSSPGGKYNAMNSYGTAGEIFDFESGESKGTYTGKVLSITDAGDCYGILDNQGFIVGADGKSRTWPLHAESGKYGAQSSLFRNDLDLESDLLLTISNTESGQQLILQRFSTGQLILSMPLNTSMDLVDGFIEPGGQRVFVGKSKVAVSHANTPEAYKEQIHSFAEKDISRIERECSMIIYPGSAAQLEKTAALNLLGRQLTEAESSSLGGIK